MSTDGPPMGEPGFDLYANQQGRIIATSVALIVLTTAFVSLRLLSRRLSRAGFWWDDFYAVIALVFCVVSWSTMFVQIGHGYGRHIYTFGEDKSKNTRLWLRTLYVFEPLYHTSTTLAKYSILAFYYRIFAIPQFRRILWIIAAFVTCYVISVDLVCLFQCTPVHSFWDVGVPGHCINIDRFFLASGAVNVLLDFIIFALPIPLLWRLRTSFNQKLVLTAIFTVAGFVVIVSIIRLIVLSRISETDLTWNYINGGIWSATEPSVAVICACLPSLRPLFSSLLATLSRIPSMPRLNPRLPKRLSFTNTTTDSSTSGGRWIKTKSHGSTHDEEELSRLDVFQHGNKTLGHDVEVRGGDAVDEGGRAWTGEGIRVKTEVLLVSTQRLDYRDRLF
ncbi:MAG: hypothetical protein Q9207_003296 [Kuettlingeria erythrocarpa]